MSTSLSVAVVGLGKVGLPVAALYATRGARVIGCDVDPAVVDGVNAGRSPVGGEPGLEEAVASAVAAGLLRATADAAEAVRASDVTVIVVPVGVDALKRVDFTHLDLAAAAVGRGLRPGSLVILETTVPVGATRGRLRARLASASGLAPEAFLLAHSPERVSSGSVLRDLATYPKVVGGVDPASGEAAAAFYRRVLPAEVMLLPDAETAEFAKLAESVYRDVNIALANELARAAETLGVDFAIASRAANSQPYSHLHNPGVGVGGHCIPVYPYFLTESVRDLGLLTYAREINDSMAAHAANRLAATLGEGGLAGRTVLILGLSYRGGVKESAHSSALMLAEELSRRGARVLVHDPLYSDEEVRAHDLEPSPLPPAAPVDAAVLQAAHPVYLEMDLSRLGGCRAFLDGRSALDRARVEAAGIRYLAIGLG
jgi:nucleotide sugar dehydrogenase